MKKLVTFRLDAALLEKVRQMAQAENRNLTNFVETVLKRSCDLDDFRGRSAAGSSSEAEAAPRTPSTN